MPVFETPWSSVWVWLHVICDVIIASAYVWSLRVARPARDLRFDWWLVALPVSMIAAGILTCVSPALLGPSVVLQAIAAVAALLLARAPARAEQHKSLLSREALEARVRERTAELEAKNRVLEEMRAQHALDDRFRVLLEMAPDAIIVTGADARIGFVNVQAERMFGYLRSELIGQPLDLLIPQQFRGAHAEHLRRFFRSPTARPMGSGIALFGLRKDGTELPIEVSLSPLQTDDGMTVSAAVRDISERKRLEAASKLLADRLSSAVGSIQDAFALFDDRDRLVLCNGVYRQLIGDALPGSLEGRPFSEILDVWIDQLVFSGPAARAQFRAERLRQRGRLGTTSFDLKLKDGRSVRVIDRPTAEGGTVKTIWDLTDDVRLAEELRHARIAAEAASNAKTEFLSSMSHELRTPLNAVLGFAQLLQRDKKEPLSERHRERVGQIVRGGEHLLRLIDDILDLSRIEAGRVALTIEPLVVRDVLQQVANTLEPLAARRSLTLEVEPVPPDLPRIAADSTRFTQILMNYGSNATKYNKATGRVVFRVTQPRADRVRISVCDTGIGIPADQHDKLFQAFQRAGQEAGPVEGTGIGLFITKRLAELMRAEVGFSSSFGEGSEFWVDVPVYDERLTSQAALVNAAPPIHRALAVAGRRTILYVEDNPASVALMEDLVDGFEHVALVATPTAELGIELARAHRPDVIVMDINLPGLSGFDALRALRADPELPHTPVIALSAAASEHDRQRGLEAGFHAYLTKPLDVDAFVALVQPLLR
jgi:PAS domain S-box-containing protein